jgi:type I restriction enzyme S subunit
LKWFLDFGQFVPIAKQTTSVAHLGAERFAKMLLAVPFREQCIIEQRLSAVQAKLDYQASRLKKLRGLKEGLEYDLSTSRVIVPVS